MIITGSLEPMGFRSDTFPLEKGMATDDITIRSRGGFVLTFE